MKQGKAVFNIKTRQDISNPFHNIPRKELLARAGVEDISKNYRVIELSGDRIRVVKDNKK